MLYVPSTFVLTCVFQYLKIINGVYAAVKDTCDKSRVATDPFVSLKILFYFNNMWKTII